MSQIVEDYFTVDQFADLHRVHRKTVYRWIREGTAPRHEVLGRMIWIEKKDARNWRPRDGRVKHAKRGSE